jgi:hypothetical protein
MQCEDAVGGLSKDHSAHLPSEWKQGGIGASVFQYLALASRHFHQAFSSGVSGCWEVQVASCIASKLGFLTCVANTATQLFSVLCSEPQEQRC